MVDSLCTVCLDEDMAHNNHDNEVIRTMVEQIGGRTIRAISGGRIKRCGPLSIRLMAGGGYHVEVTYEEGTDTYTVERLFIRGDKVFVKGVVTDVYCDMLADTCWQASLWRDGGFGHAEGVIEASDGTMAFV